MQAQATAIIQSTVAARPQQLDFEVNANKDWQTTGIYVQKGEWVLVTYVYGTWSPDQNVPNNSVGAGGLEKLASPISSTQWPDNLVSGCHHGGLIGFILHQDGASPIICIENTFGWTADGNGVLQLRINDKVTSDNSGSIIVRIEVH